MDDNEFNRLFSENKTLNGDELRIQRWQDSVDRVMAAWPCSRERASELIVQRIERDRKKGINADKSLAKFVIDVENDPLGF